MACSYFTLCVAGRGDWHAPIPIPAQQAQQNIPSRSNYTSLKRTHSNVSNSSAASSERKTDSPRDTPTPKPIEEKPSKAPNRVRTKFTF